MADHGDKNGGNKEDNAVDLTEDLKTTPAKPVVVARQLAIESFKERFGQQPSWDRPDYVALARLFQRKPDLTVEEFARRLRFYFESSEPFVLKQGRSLTYFCSSKFDAFLEGPINSPENGKRRAAAVTAPADKYAGLRPHIQG